MFTAATNYLSYSQGSSQKFPFKSLLEIFLLLIHFLNDLQKCNKSETGKH